MKKVSVRKLSVLGMVLMAASAVTAAVIPSKSDNLKQGNSADNATLRSNSGVGGGGSPMSCVADDDQAWSCHLSGVGFTVTSVPSPNQVVSDADPFNTVGNTSNSLQGTMHAGDTTSLAF